MPSFEDREKGFERKFGHDQETAFQAKVHRNRLVARWAAGALKLEGAAAEEYENAVVDAALRGDTHLIERIAADFKAHRLPHDATRIRLEIERCAAEARKALGAA